MFPDKFGFINQQAKGGLAAVLGDSLSPLQRILSTKPLAMLKISETTGTDLADATGNGRTATSNAALGAWTPTTAFQGQNVPYFSGAARAINWMPAGSTLPAAFNGQEFSALVYAKFDLAVWTDSTTRKLIYFYFDDANQIHVGRRTTDYVLRALCYAGGATNYIDYVAASPVVWMGLLMTCSKTNDRFRFWIDNTQIGATKTSIGTWTGVPTIITVGADTTAGHAPYQGYLAYAAVWDRELSDADRAKVFF